MAFSLNGLKISLVAVILFISQSSEGVKYGAAVVEFHYQYHPNSTWQTIIDNVNQYVSIIHQYKHKLSSESNLDKGIIVFPECGLTCRDVSIPVPEPSYLLPNLTGNQVLLKLSEAAKQTGLYVVFNLVEQEGKKTYNTDVIIRSNGTIAAKYRKFNLYGEDRDRTPTPEVVSFTTDFNVTFGVFICFDILFAHPPLDLIKQGVKHFVFSSEWFSELPFLTAVQYQMSWAWMNDATLLASGLGNAAIGNTGSGIYLGRKGPLVYYQANVTEGSVLITGVLDSESESGSSPTISLLDQKQSSHSSWFDIFPLDKIFAREPNDYSDEEKKKTAYDIDEKKEIKRSLRLKKEPLNEYTTELIEPDDCGIHSNKSNLSPGQIANCTRQIHQKLCNRELCCSFNVTAVFTICKNPCETVPQTISDDFALSVHRMVVFNGIRSFDVATGGLETCGIVSCNNEDITSCGLKPGQYAKDPPQPANKYFKILYRYITSLKVEGSFSTDNTFISPDILLGQIRGEHNPSLSTFGILTNNFSMNVSETGFTTLEYASDGIHPLGTASIFNRIFARDGQPQTGSSTIRPIPNHFLIILFYPIIKLLKQS